ncbi:MAG TPA: DEAD/DEAH box helicase [Acidobacteriaceae bacterium]|nr:DEAD/DEAH box helicase [Acidobacteriaceae bacterium]
MTQFTDFALLPALQKKLATANFITPTPVQAGAIPPALEGRDVLATAQTGTGKTLSFVIPIIEAMQNAARAIDAPAPPQTRGFRQGSQGRGKSPFALILLPTRELAMQVEQAYRNVALDSSVQPALVVGGLSEGPQLQAIRRGARLIVATPGRLEDFLRRKLVQLDQVQILVLDEVDRMLDMGFKPAIKRIVAAIPAPHQTLCYSATLEGPVTEVVREYLKNPVRVEMGSVLKPAENVRLQMFEVQNDKKMPLLEHLLRSEGGSFLVFVRTKHGADRVAKKLNGSGWNATSIHGDRTQAQRSAALRSFSQGQHRVLVATDVAARGIDVAHIAHVVNYDMPKMAEDFVHRVGRTGRASKSGVASTFQAPEEKGDLRRIERALKITMERFRVKVPLTA